MLLNGQWHFLEDPSSAFLYGEVTERYRKGKISNTMRIPINWEAAGLHNFNGVVWFLKEFQFPGKPERDEITGLYFHGIDYIADIWLNDLYLGNHEGYFQPFFIPVPYETASAQTFLLVVRVLSPFEEPGTVWPFKKKLIKGIFNHHDCRPGGTSLQHGQDQNTGGIWNDVEVISGEPLFIENVLITPKIIWEQNEALITVRLSTHAAAARFTEFGLTFRFAAPDGTSMVFDEVLGFHNGKNEHLFAFRISNPVLWFPRELGEPALYTLLIGSDLFEEKIFRFGIREVFLSEKQEFFINRKRLFLRGTNIIPTQFLSTFLPEKIDRMCELLIEAHCNIVRVHAHVNRKELYEAFDRNGILAWQDFSLQWTYDESPEFSARAVLQIKDMVTHLHNHTSIVFWCCHNEPGEQIRTLDPLLRDAVLSIDNSRIIRLASNYEEHPYDGWYWGNKEHYAAAPMGPLVSEFGAQGMPERSSLESFLPKTTVDNPDFDAWQYHNFQYNQTFLIAGISFGNSTDEFILNSQTYQADLLKTAIEFYRRKRFAGITGIFQFMFIDCWESISWSIIDFYGKKKLGFDALRTAYQPVFLSAFLRQARYLPGAKMLFDLWVINDLQLPISDASLCIRFNKETLAEWSGINIESDSHVFFWYEKIDLTIPENAPLGISMLFFELKDPNGTLISQNLYSISIENHIQIIR